MGTFHGFTIDESFIVISWLFFLKLHLICLTSDPSSGSSLKILHAFHSSKQSPKQSQAPFNQEICFVYVCGNSRKVVWDSSVYTFSDLSQRVDSVKEESLKLRSENQVLGQYIQNLMASSAVFHSAQPKAAQNK